MTRMNRWNRAQGLYIAYLPSIVLRRLTFYPAQGLIRGREKDVRSGKRVVIAGGGPRAISTGLAFLKCGFDVRIFERQSECKAIGGAVLLSTPNKSGDIRAKLPFNTEVERRMGVKGWHYGVLRSSAFKKMLELVPEGVIYTNHEFSPYTELDDRSVQVEFTNGKTITGDILVGADGIRSGVSRQVFGDPKLFHTGIRLWLDCFFPMLHDGKPGFEWWVVEPSWEGKPVPADPKAHLTEILKDWAQPMPRFTEIYNRPSMEKWSKDRIVCVGDAVHPVSPYAAYGMGMAIEDGYYLARALDGVDLHELRAVSAGFEIYEKQRINYITHDMEFARFLGRMFHALPWPLAKLRDLLFDYTPVLSRYLRQGYLEKAEKETINLKELQVI
ncbi:hypothetical protein BJX62DRAFT_230559 [Aspergillus germanicus]